MTSDSLPMDCKACGKQIAVKAKSCPHCGAKRFRFRALKWIGGGFIGLIIVSAALAPEKSERQAVSVVASKAAAVPLPTKQTTFISAIADYSKRFNAASNELQQSALRDQRRAAILAALGPQLEADGWVGTLRKLETNGDGKAIVTVRLAPDVDILTWNNALSDALHSTMIEKGTPLYAALMNMAVRDKVKVSGIFIRADLDGIFENSMTIKGAMTTPEFLFRFNNISKQ
ncbi:zinc ribbon domain-containing protein [Neorhizobium galegae]|uniref:zinc ribbon domain-containing protein n=1 Tax=Neorhizobium galegae TaxID=399 RepID=UPI0021074DC2|nr:zinc ribbon domain-containing protein [Neorhizobium galegae]MCQ1772887.1 zinc ribbon domain-containing protein [Neorhizobium galegae]MCQ1799166.1 zinc ribbon domain-containing protein [Neorhizobium galegae]